MANTKNSTTKSTATKTATVEESAVAVKNVKTVERKVVEPLKDTDEIEVISLIPNVSYKDSKTNDMYEWDEVGHKELMTVDILKNMWRNSKGYFRNMWLKPLDDRIINQFGLTKTYEKYEFLMDESNYTQKNIEELCETISSAPNPLKYSLCGKVKSLVASGKVSDVRVIRAFEKSLKIDLVSSL